MSPRPAGHYPLRSLVGWALVAPAAVAAAARALRVERPAVIAAEAVAPLVSVPALVALGVAIGGRRRALASVAGGLVALELRWWVPELRPSRPRPVEADGSPRFRVLTANLFTHNSDIAGMAAEVREADADVVLLQELSYRNLSGLREHGALDGYPHQLLSPRADPSGTAILSRLPLVDEEEWHAVDRPMTRGTVIVGDRRVRVYCIHPRAPFGRQGLPHWRGQFIALHDAVRSEPRPLVVAGDFNAPWRQRRFRALMAEGLRDAHVEGARGWARTWPSNIGRLPPLARIDHVLVSDELAALAVREGKGHGSDHLPVVVDLALVG